jgi:excinuclease UvrABC helicase subunit UvrB
MESLSVYPAKHFVTPDERIEEACNAIQEELETSWNTWKKKANCWRPSGWSSAPATTWR